MLRISFFWILFYLSRLPQSITDDSVDIDLENSIIWGLGIERPQLTLPVRYFYLQLVDSDGRNITSAPSEDFITLQISGDSAVQGRDCRAGAQVIDRHDGSYILRYKLVTTCKSIEINIRAKDGRPVAKSPKILSAKGPYHPEVCFCPKPWLNEWETLAECPNTYEQIELDLSPWKHGTVNFSDVLAQAEQRWASRPGAHSFCHYSFRSNEIYRKCYGQYVGFKMFSDAIFLSLARKFPLPDTDFLMNLGDWPLELRPLTENPIPLISWCGSTDTRDVILPTYEMTEATLESMGRQSLDTQSVQKMTTYKWSEKVPKGIFRGRDSRQERLDLVEIARKHPDVLEAGITRFFFFKKAEIDRYGPEEKHIPFGDFFKYRYLINVDGTVAAYRLPFYLLGDSLVLKQDSPYYEFFYPDLKPWIHYVPLKRDLSDVVDKILWAKDNEEKVLRIIKQAQEFARHRLQPTEIFCYHAKLFEAYQKILKPIDRVLPKDLEVVDQPEPQQTCQCKESSQRKKEEL